MDAISSESLQSSSALALKKISKKSDFRELLLSIDSFDDRSFVWVDSDFNFKIGKTRPTGFLNFGSLERNSYKFSETSDLRFWIELTFSRSVKDGFVTVMVGSRKKQIQYDAIYWALTSHSLRPNIEQAIWKEIRDCHLAVSSDEIDARLKSLFG